MDGSPLTTRRGNWSADQWTYDGTIGVAREDVVQIVRRSALIMPVNVSRFIEKAWTRGADAIVLDLEDSVTHSQKTAARALVRNTFPTVSKGGADILVRINKPFDLAVKDLDASIWPGLAGIWFPKAERAEEIRILDRLIAEREMARDMPLGGVQISIAIETALGLHNALSIATASPRVATITLGAEDFTLDIDIEPTSEGKELFLGKMEILRVARLAGIQAMGTLASLADFTDVARVARLATEARRVGYRGSSCIHPAQVPALNEGFSFSAEEVQHARNVISALEAAESKGLDAVAVDGKMVDIPVADRARRTLARVEAIARKDARKREAVEAESNA